MSIYTQLPETLYPESPPELQAISTFAMDNARALGWASQLAYETDDRPKVERILKRWGWESRGCHAGRIASVLPLTSAKGFIASRDGITILTFSGTDPLSLADWIVDFSIHLSGGDIHEGFKTGVAAVWDTISSVLGTGGAAANDKLFITGHSLGGALAVVAALRLLEEKVAVLERILGVYTYGQPRAGGETFVGDFRAAGLADRTYRLIDGVDIVPQVPPVPEPFTFRHVGSSLACGHGAFFAPDHLVPDEQEQAQGGIGLLGLLRNVVRPVAAPADLPGFPGDPDAAVVIDRLPRSIRDHLMDRYLRALQTLQVP